MEFETESQEDKNDFEFDCTLEIIENEEDIPERFKGKLKKGEMLLKARSLTTDFLPEEWLKELAEDSVNGRFLYRHRDPESEKWRGRPYGRILDWENVEFEEDGETKKATDKWYRLFGDSKIEKTMQEYILKKQKSGEKIGISSGYIVNRDKNGDIKKVFHLEDSITHIPECPNCVIQEVVQLEKMTDMKEEVDAKAKEIEALQKELEEAKLQLEKKDSSLAELKGKVEKLKSESEKTKEEKLTLEEKLMQKNETLKSEIHKLEEKIFDMEKKPYLEKIEKLEKEQGIFDEDIFEIEQGWKIEKLEKRLKKLSENPKIAVVTKSLEEEREEMEEHEAEADVGTEKAFRGNEMLLNMVQDYKTRHGLK